MYSDCPLTNNSGLLRLALSGILPEYFKLYAKLLQLTKPDHRELFCNLDRLSKKINYNPRALYCYLDGLETIGFLNISRDNSSSKLVTITLLVEY